MSKAPAAMRLDRLLANMGYGSRREIQQLARAGQVTLDGVAVADADLRVPVAPELSQRLRVQGRPLDPPPGLALMLHKPLGVTCSHKEAGALRATIKRIFGVDLDAPSVTNDTSAALMSLTNSLTSF